MLKSAFSGFTVSYFPLQQVHVQMEEVPTLSHTQHSIVGGTKPRRGRQAGSRNRPTQLDMNGMTSVVVTTSDVQHHDDENVVAVSGIPGNIQIQAFQVKLQSKVRRHLEFLLSGFRMC